MTPRRRCLDTSVLIAATFPWHPRQAELRVELAERPAIADHSILEFYATVTALPREFRVSTAAAAALLAELEFEPVTLPVDQRLALPGLLAAHGVAGGATYDALIGRTAASNGCTLRTLDRRAAATYAAVGAAVDLL